MANTTNLNMVKPAGTDHALISVINSNMDIIDGAVGALPSGSTLQGEIDSANTAIANYITATGVSKYISTGSMDDIKTPGRYFYANQLTNRPSTTDGYLDVYALNANYIKQVAHESVTYKMYVRYCNNGTWSAWQELALKSDISTGVTVRRSIVTTSSSVAAGGDYAITTQAITNGVVGGVPTGYTQLAIIPEGVRPNTSWNADPRLFYNDVSTMQKFQIHNHGSSGDTMTATFIIFYVKNA